MPLVFTEEEASEKFKNITWVYRRREHPRNFRRDMVG
jgi:hypothetical protein